jgi:hypothetical protein
MEEIKTLEIGVHPQRDYYTWVASKYPSCLALLSYCIAETDRSILAK